MIKAVVFDLDDTLYPEEEYVKSGFHAIADAFNDEDLYERLYSLFKEEKSNVYQRAGFSEEQCKRCIEIYRSHIPNISLAHETETLLKRLKKRGCKLGIITDGRPEGQRNKIKALGLEEMMDCIIVTDEMGGVEYRKPNPKAFKVMKDVLGMEFDEMIYIGDNPAKDFCIKSVYPITTVQLITEGIYNNNSYKSGIKPDFQVNKLTAITDYI